MRYDSLSHYMICESFTTIPGLKKYKLSAGKRPHICSFQYEVQKIWEMMRCIQKMKNVEGVVVFNIET